MLSNISKILFNSSYIFKYEFSVIKFFCQLIFLWNRLKFFEIYLDNYFLWFFIKSKLGDENAEWLVLLTEYLEIVSLHPIDPQNLSSSELWASLRSKPTALGLCAEIKAAFWITCQKTGMIIHVMWCRLLLLFFI